MNKTLEFYMTQPYTVEVFPDKEEGGFVARVKEFRGCITQAEHWGELLLHIEEAKRGWLEVALELQMDIPEPLPEAISH